MATVKSFGIVLGLMAPCICLGAGTVGIAEIDALLLQKPEIRAFLMSSLDLDSTAIAAVRFGPHVKHLGGARMGPYMVQARPKAPKGASLLEVVICTETRFFDAYGKTTGDETNAVRLEEKLTAIMLREAGGAPAIPNCP